MKQKNQGFIIPILITIVALLAVTGGVYFYANKNSNPQILNQNENTVATTSDSIVNIKATSSVPQKTTPNTPVVCTMDAMQCPDGSYVGRTGPNCEFVCPDTSINESSSGYIKSVYAKSGKSYLDIDYIEIIAGGPNGTSVRNNNTKIRTFEISPAVKITLQNDFIDGQLTSGNYVISFDKFISIISDTKDIRTNNPWDVVIKNNLIISITGNFRP